MCKGWSFKSNDSRLIRNVGKGSHARVPMGTTWSCAQPAGQIIKRPRRWNVGVLGPVRVVSATSTLMSEGKISVEEGVWR